MKTYRISMSFSMIILFSFSSCEEELSLGEHRFTYQVITESGDWFGSYINSHGELIYLNEEPYQLSEWTYSFSVNEIPSELFIEATSELFNDSTVVNKPDITTSIFIDGELVVSQTNHLDDGKTVTAYPNTTDYR